MLCELCKKIKPPHELKGGIPKKDHHFCITRHHATFADLARSAEGGCELCKLFIPFAVRGSSDLTLEAGSSLDDPFEPDCESGDCELCAERDRLPKYHVDDNVYYVEEGHYWKRVHTSHDAARRAEYEHIVDHEEGECTYSESAHDELLQWLMLCSQSQSGPEQLWVTVGDLECVDSSIQWQQVEANWIIQISAGSINAEAADYEATYCLEGIQLVDKRELGVREPALFAEPWRDLSTFQRGRSVEPHFEFFQKREQAGIVNPAIVARDVAEHANSEQCFRLIAGWIKDCEQLHVLCSAPDPRVYPTRLVQISDSEHTPTRLVATKDSVEAPTAAYRYATLTHCWGRPEQRISMLLRANYLKFCESINETELSQNFQDAITIARRLKIPYLWVDALCIIQDSYDDWETESTRMSEYYSNSTITISALSSVSGSNGILKSRDESAIAIPASVNGQELYIRPVLSDALATLRTQDNSLSSIRPVFARIPLNERSWTLQERLFSTRVVHFSEEQIFWQCKTCLATEDNQYILPPELVAKARMEDLVEICRDLSDDSGAGKTTIVKTRWYEAVGDYTSRSLTYDSDKLPAISSIAKRVHQVTGAEYLAGLWLDGSANLVDNLLWTFLPSWARSSRDKPARVFNGSPSWSWSSTMGGVEFPTIQLDRNAKEDLDPAFGACEVVPMNPTNPFGQVCSGRIEVHGWTHAYSGPDTLDFLWPSKQKFKEIRRLVDDGLDEADNDSREGSWETDSDDSSGSSSDASSSKGSDSSDESSNDKTDSVDGSHTSISERESSNDNDSGSEESSTASSGGGSNSSSSDNSSSSSSGSGSGTSSTDSSTTLPFGRLDVSNPEYDFESIPHIAAYMAHFNESFDDVNSDSDDDYEGPQQYFLILKLVGLTSWKDPHHVTKGEGDIDEQSRTLNKPTSQIAEFDEFEGMDLEEPVGSWERVGWAKTGAHFPIIRISQEDGWKRQKMVLV